MKKPIKNFENKGNLISKQGMKAIKGGVSLFVDSNTTLVLNIEINGTPRIGIDIGGVTKY